MLSVGMRRDRFAAAPDAALLVLATDPARALRPFLRSGSSDSLAVQRDQYANAGRQPAVPQKVTATATAGETA